MSIKLKDIWPIENVGDYKVHFGRDFIFSLMNFYRFSLMNFYREKDGWLFGGIFRVLAQHEDRYAVRPSEPGMSI